MKRWLAQITYNDGTPGQSIAFEELDELRDIIERGPDWNVIHKIVVTLNRRSVEVACGKCGWQGKQSELGGKFTVGGCCYCPSCRANFNPIPALAVSAAVREGK